MSVKVVLKPSSPKLYNPMLDKPEHFVEDFKIKRKLELSPVSDKKQSATPYDPEIPQENLGYNSMIDTNDEITSLKKRLMVNDNFRGKILLNIINFIGRSPPIQKRNSNTQSSTIQVPPKNNLKYDGLESTEDCSSVDQKEKSSSKSKRPIIQPDIIAKIPYTSHIKCIQYKQVVSHFGNSIIPCLPFPTKN